MNAGKGDSPRPVILAIYQKNYDAIFRKSEKKSEKRSEKMSENNGISNESENGDIKCQECLEQARLLGISASREEALRGKMLRMEKALLAIADSDDESKWIAIKALNIWPNDPSPFDSPDHDNDDSTYSERI